jgi:hypothetical protein
VRIVNLKVENIKKLIGWCPNARAYNDRQHVNLENFNSDVPDRARGEGDTKSLGWFRKESTIILLTAISVTFVYFIVLNHVGINLIFLLAGTFISLICFAFYWKTQIRIYNDLVKQPVTEYSKKMRIAMIAIILVLSSARYLFGIIVGQELAWQAMLSLYGGFLIFIWLSYLQIKYWEKVNHKKIFFNKREGTWKRSYIIQETK